MEIDKDLFKQFIDSQRAEEKGDGLVNNSDESLLYRFLSDCDCWKLLERRILK